MRHLASHIMKLHLLELLSMLRTEDKISVKQPSKFERFLAKVGLLIKISIRKGEHWTAFRESSDQGTPGIGHGRLELEVTLPTEHCRGPNFVTCDVTQLWCHQVRVYVHSTVFIPISTGAKSVTISLDTCVNYAKINNSVLHLRGHVPAGFFCCDVTNVLFLHIGGKTGELEGTAPPSQEVEGGNHALWAPTVLQWIVTKHSISELP